MDASVAEMKRIVDAAILRLPRNIRALPMREFMSEFGGDVRVAVEKEKRQNRCGGVGGRPDAYARAQGGTGHACVSLRRSTRTPALCLPPNPPAQCRAHGRQVGARRGARRLCHAAQHAAADTTGVGRRRGCCSCGTSARRGKRCGRGRRIRIHHRGASCEGGEGSSMRGGDCGKYASRCLRLVLHGRLHGRRRRLGQRHPRRTLGSHAAVATPVPSHPAFHSV